MKIISGSASKKIAEELATILNCKQIPIQTKRFVDGELYLCLQESVNNEDIVVVQTTYPDENIIELLLLLDAIRRGKAATITVVIPYFGYARQDKQFKTGEPVSADALAKLISVNADMVITVDPHKEHILSFFSVPAASVSAAPDIAEYFKDKDIDMVLAPDKGAFSRAQIVAGSLGCDMDYLEKKRIDDKTITIKTKRLGVAQKSILIVDDIISTGTTMAGAIQELKNQEASTVSVACTHGLFAGDAISKLKKAGCNELIATDTIATPLSKISIASALAEAIR